MRSPSRVDSLVGFVYYQSVPCPSAATIHGFGHTDIMSVSSPHSDIVDQYLDRGCIQDFLLQFGIRKNVLVTSRPCSDLPSH